jgi:hypothetical protein
MILLVIVSVFAPSVAIAARMLYQADFSKRQGGWPSENAKLDSVGYVTGGYRILIKRGHLSFPTPSVEMGRAVPRLDVRTDATELAAVGAHAFGVGCFGGGMEGYVLGASPDNGFANVWKMTRTRGIRFLKQGGKGGAAPRTHVRLQGHCTASQSGRPAMLALDLNGERIIGATDRHGLKSFDRVGLFAFSDGGRLEVVFHHIVAQQP